MLFVTVFIIAFMASDYLFTGSVTETWIGIAVISGITTAVIRWIVAGFLRPMVR